MLFNSIHFIIFFPIVIGIYFVVPKKIRYIWLLIASYYFYMSWSARYAILIGTSTIITWLCGVLLDYFNVHTPKNTLWCKKIAVIICIIINLGILFFFKYFNFSIDILNYFLLHFNINTVERFSIVLPVGISFYTFQALSYVIDVYRGDTPAEKNLLKYGLFVSFFPQLVAGPIERSKNLLTQIKDLSGKNLFDYERIANGFIIMLWGYFIKMMIADRAAVIVDTVYNSWQNYGSTELILATVLFAIQIYCDFSGYSLIAIGAAQVMGFSLMENFNVPYFAKSIKDFWSRWHISLSTWFRDYLYIPLGGNRCSKLKKYVNLMITFLCSGLWHGAALTYIIWGGIHGLYQIIGQEFKPIRDKIYNMFKVKTDADSFKLWQIIYTFILTDFAWILFRANSFSDAKGIIGGIFTKFNPWVLMDGTLGRLGLDYAELAILFLSCMLLFIVDLIKYKRNLRLDSFLEKQNMPFRWVWVIVLSVVILVFGVYGNAYDAQAFIYFQF